MENFQLYIPTELVLAPDAETFTADYLLRYGTKVLLVPGGDFIIKTPWYQSLLKSLQGAGLDVQELAGVQPNPTVDLVRKGIQICKEKKNQCLLAVGGGSAIDTAKAIALGAVRDDDVWEVFANKHPIETALPVGVVMTMMSTGSEGSNGTVINNPATGEKFDIMSDCLRPMFCLMNPHLTLSIPEHHVYCGAVDMLSHVLERYFSTSRQVAVTSRMGEGLMKGIMESAYQLKQDFTNYHTRANLMLASIYAHNNIIGVGRTQEWSTHILAAALGGEYNLIHGDAIAILLPHWASYVKEDHLDLFGDWGKAVFGLSHNLPSKQAAEDAIHALRGFLKDMGMPSTLREVGIQDDSGFEKLADHATRFGNFGTLRPLSRNDILSILRSAL